MMLETSPGLKPVFPLSSASQTTTETQGYTQASANQHIVQTSQSPGQQPQQAQGISKICTTVLNIGLQIFFSDTTTSRLKNKRWYVAWSIDSLLGLKKLLV